SPEATVMTTIGTAATVNNAATTAPGTTAAAGGTARPRTTGTQHGQTSPHRATSPVVSTAPASAASPSSRPCSRISGAAAKAAGSMPNGHGVSQVSRSRPYGRAQAAATNVAV